jgi:hypothetical protein
MKKLILISLLLLTGCNGKTKEYQEFLDTHKTTSHFYCKNSVLVNEYFNDINATKPTYRIIVINNETVVCNIKEGYINIPNLGIKVMVED